MTNAKLTLILDNLRALILKSRPAYRDYLGESDELKVISILENAILLENQNVASPVDPTFTGFVANETYQVSLDGEEFDAVAFFSRGIVCISNVSASVFESGKLPANYWIVASGSEFPDAVAVIGDGTFAGKAISVRFETTVVERKWDVKKLPYDLLPDQLFSTLREMMEKLSSQIKSLQVDPVFSGSFSQNRKPEGIIGNNSHAEGNSTTASGNNSHAEGSKTTATGNNSHAEGNHTAADGFGSHAEGSHTTASGEDSHAEGSNTAADGFGSHAEGNSTTASGNNSHAEGVWTVASASAQHVEGMYNIDDNSNSDKLHIVGNGEYNKRSNAHTLDKSGNAWYAGDVYVGSTSGTNRDAGSKKLATEAYVDDTKLVIASPGGKKFKITVDDTGTLSATEVTDTTT